jgi:hypothetical protein
LGSLSSEWIESEFYVAAAYNPTDNKIYFISTHESLVDETPAPPERVKAELWLEKINQDGTKRERLVQLPASAHAEVIGYPDGDKRSYLTDRSVKLHMSPSFDKVAVEESWGSLIVVDLHDNKVHTLLGKTATNDFGYGFGIPFIAWLPDDQSLLLLLHKHQEHTPSYEYAIGASPAAQFHPTLLWRQSTEAQQQPPPPRVHTNNRRDRTDRIEWMKQRNEWIKNRIDRIVWVGCVGENMLINADQKVLAISANLNHLTMEGARPTPLQACYSIISGPQSNIWLTSEGDIVDEQLRVIKKLPGLSSREMSAGRTPHAWCSNGIIVTDPLKGLQILDPDTGTTRTIIASRIDQRSYVKDRKAYQAFRQAKLDWIKEYDKKQRAEVEKYTGTGKEKKELSKLAAGLNRHDTNTLNQVHRYLGQDNLLCEEACQMLMQANWSEADALISAFLLGGTNGGINHRCNVLHGIADKHADRFCDTLIQIASNFPSYNKTLVDISSRGLGNVKASPQVDNCLASLIVKNPDFNVRQFALQRLERRNKALFYQTLRELADDKKFLEFYMRPRLYLRNDTNLQSLRF